MRSLRSSRRRAKGGPPPIDRGQRRRDPHPVDWSAETRRWARRSPTHGLVLVGLEAAFAVMHAPQLRNQGYSRAFLSDGPFGGEAAQRSHSGGTPDLDPVAVASG